MTTTNTNNQTTEKRAVKEFLMHLAGELRMQELALEGKPASPSLQKRVTQFRSQHGSDLLPEVGLMCFLAGDSDDGGAQRDATRQALASRRRDQLEQVKGVIALLGEVEM